MPQLKAARRGGGAGKRRNVTLQKSKNTSRGGKVPSRAYGASVLTRAIVTDAPVIQRVLGVPAARVLVVPPTGLVCDAGRLVLGTADALIGGKVFTVLISPRTCDPMDLLRAAEYYRGRLAGPVTVTYEPAQNITLPGTVTMRPVLLPGADYVKPVPASAALLATHASLARACAGAVRTRITDGVTTRLVLGPEYQAEVENDVAESAVPHTSESFRLDKHVVLIEITVCDVPAAFLANGDQTLGNITVMYNYAFSGRHPPGVDA